MPWIDDLLDYAFNRGQWDLESMGTGMGQDLEDLVMGMPELVNAMSTMTPDEVFVQPTIENWSNPNEYATEHPGFFMADVLTAGAGAKGLYGAARRSPTLSRLAAEERGGGTFGADNPNPARPTPEQMYQELMSGKGYYNPDGSLTPKGQLMQKLLQESSIGKGAETIDPRRLTMESMIDDAMRREGRYRNMMQPEGTGERWTTKGRQESFSPERPQVGGESQQWAPYDVEAEGRLRKPPDYRGGRTLAVDEEGFLSGEYNPFETKPKTSTPRRTRPSNQFNERYNEVTEATEGMRPKTYDKRGIEISDEPISGGFERASYVQGNIGRRPPDVKEFQAPSVNPGASTMARLNEALNRMGTGLSENVASSVKLTPAEIAARKARALRY